MSGINDLPKSNNGSSVSRLVKFLLQRNTLLSMVVMLLNTGVLLLYHDQKVGVLLSLSLLWTYLYFYRASRAKKWRMLFTYTIFSILTILGEEGVIQFSKGKALSYGTPSLKSHVPLWLFGAYLNMVILVWLLDDFALRVQEVIT